MKEKIGIFGGTFDPLHMGHLIAAETARERLELDKILFMPAHQPPHKLDLKLTSPEHRLTMLRLAVEGNKHFDISTVELDRKGTSYTVDTLQEVITTLKPSALFLLIGM